MHAEVHKEPNYLAVFGVLLVLTVLEVVIFKLGLPRITLIIALSLMALVKAFLVAWYFMHLRSERWTLIFITIIPFLLAIDLLLGLMSDIAHRIF